LDRPGVDYFASSLLSADLFAQGAQLGPLAAARLGSRFHVVVSAFHSLSEFMHMYCCW